MVALHIIMVLFGYLFFLLYTLLPDGEEYAHKSLPVILKNYQPPASPPYLVFYADDYFGVFSIAEIIKLYELCNSETQKSLLNYLE